VLTNTQINHHITNAPDIRLGNAVVTSASILQAVAAVNAALSRANEPIEDISFQLYDVIDLRMLSGLIGEMFVDEICDIHDFLRKNPNIDGYPDLLDLSTTSARQLADTTAIRQFLSFSHGGLEVKNTFGVKKAKTQIPPRATRLGKLKPTLVWKAHHQQTNDLVALQSDYVDRVPQIVAVFYSKDLTPADWTLKQEPRAGSTMTSFCQTRRSAFEKLRRGLRLYRVGFGLESFLGIAE
jgi:hypothetical protein